MQEPSRAAAAASSPQRRHAVLHGFSLAFLAGYVDAFGFVALFGLLTAHVTGNFVMIGASLADPSKASILIKLLAFPAFIAGVATGRIFIARMVSRQRPALEMALLLELALLTSYMVCGMLATPIGATVGALAMAAGLCGAAAMGLHSAISRLLMTDLAPTSVMTGNVTQLVIETVDLIAGWGDSGNAARCKKLLVPVLGFALGAPIAATGFHYFGFTALAVPLLILLALIGMEHRTAARAVLAAA